MPAQWNEPVEGEMPGVGAQVFGGDLDGVAERLDYLEELGVNVVYLTPFFPGESNHRYDARTFAEVDELLGGSSALQRLSEKAHARGFRVIGDFTTNHTGVTHEWFVSASSGDDAEARDHYYFGSNHGASGYASWLGVPSLPKLNYASDSLRAKLFDGPESVVERWLRPPFSLDGWRIDVANMSGRHGADDHYEEVQLLTRQAAVRANPDAVVIAEHCHDLARDVDGTGWHGAMNYSAFTRPVWTWLRDTRKAPNFLGSPLLVPKRGGRAVVDTMEEFISQVPWEVTRSSWNLLGSHDTTRIATLVGNVRLVEVAAGFLFAMPGVPMMTYGDEVGMEGEWGEDGRKPMPWSGVDKSSELWRVYAALINVRRSSTALTRGGLRWVAADDDFVVFVREHQDECVLVHLSRRGHEPLSVDAGLLPGIQGGRLLFGRAPALEDECITLIAEAASVNLWSWVPELPAALMREVSVRGG
ncbi:glycoside hydrolase family 13 protein [Ornithinimicrobium tianjinense]|uniref:Glycosyl hydrolase family 13 catalytic domain-containing protein n=1 Tax=Ornithinimicrobium tianjinense TaxID=1195761 RepID=A0A917BRH8_9MICO|nr:glycoside hydrolase family 13 protein [Ornithinimicrobium tianjinense]GGF56259.1 hypothetical protein GCM10011366_25160 [Ornithinimicrobium tianjinense]